MARKNATPSVVAEPQRTGGSPTARTEPEVFGAFPTLEAFIATGGSIDVGRLADVEYAAIAADASVVWVALNRVPGESLFALLRRLDDTLRDCLRSGLCVDELERAADG